MISFQNSYSQLPEKFFEKVQPETFSNPKLIKFNERLAKDLNIEITDLSTDEIAQIFSGQKLLIGSEPLAMAYAGHQFGHFSPQLGDGRAHLLGEVSGYDIQLKGSGRTRYSRRGDGRSALGPVLREYIVSEAMHSLGVPSTRSLCAVATGENVLRQFGPEPGGILTRVAESHLRVGSFEFFAYQKDPQALEALLNYTIQRHYPELKKLNTKDKALGLLRELSVRQSHLVAKWTALGFIHGVMNTDNFSVAGITIDYGPCAFMDNFEFSKVFSSIDQDGRYAFFNQLPIAQWNLIRLADCLLPIIDKDIDAAAQSIEDTLRPEFEKFEFKRMEKLAAKLGITDYTNKDEDLVMNFLKYLENEKVDFTLAFRNLSQLYSNDTSFYKTTNEFTAWTHEWKDRIECTDGLEKINPLFIPRNHQIEKAIQMAYKDDFSAFHRLNKVLQNPFDYQADSLEYAKPPLEDEVVCETFCGT